MGKKHKDEESQEETQESSEVKKEESGEIKISHLTGQPIASSHPTKVIKQKE